MRAMITKLVGFALIGCLWLPLAGEAGDSLRCERGLVGPGALKIEVLAACGEPDDRAQWFQGQGAPFVPTETWTYNFGPNQFLRLLRFRDGRLRQVEADGYGFPSAPAGRCAPRDIQTGISAYRLRRQCGEPATIDVIEVLAPPQPSLRPPGYRPVAVVPIHRELWVYNFGSRHFLRAVTLENGRVVAVENGRRGFD